MHLSELRNEPHLSASSIGGYVDCGLAYRFSKIDKIKPEFVPDALVYGSVIHQVLEFYHHQRMIGDKPSLMELTALFEKKWTIQIEETPDIQFKRGKDAQSLLLEGKSLLATYYTSYPDSGYRVIALEEAFRFEVSGLPLPIIGAIDMLEEDEAGTIIITDHKTTARAYSTDEIDQNFQMTIYGMAMKAAGYGDREIILRLDCLIKTKKPRFEQYYTVRSEEDEHRALRKIQSVWEGICKGVFIPNDGSWKCKGCSYQRHCAEWFRS